MLTLDDRPFCFDDMIGQKNIIGEMRKRSKTMDFPEVMLFCGASGTGKTTLALIISALLNDPNPIRLTDGSYKPNPDSPSSKDILNTLYHRDVIFKDASSMNKDDVLDLNEIVSTAPMFDKNKILIIDECQELGKAGKGATLTFLEKKRKGVYVILCTMDESAFDKSIRSRATMYRFVPPTRDEIAEYLLNCTVKLGLPDSDDMNEFYGDGLYAIADNCEGSVRLAMQMFERCVAGEIYRTVDIEKEFGVISDKKFQELFLRIMAHDKNVMEDVANSDLHTLFKMLTSAVINARIYFITGYAKSEWMASQYEALKDKNGLGAFVKGLTTVDANGYFRKDLFLYQVAEFVAGYPDRRLLEQQGQRMAQAESISNGVRAVAKSSGGSRVPV